MSPVVLSTLKTVASVAASAISACIVANGVPQTGQQWGGLALAVLTALSSLNTTAPKNQAMVSGLK
jgi:hypothetical protein